MIGKLKFTLILIGIIFFSSAIALSNNKDKRVVVEFVFVDFYNDHIKMTINENKLLDLPITVIENSTGLAMRGGFELKECNQIKIYTNRYKLAHKFCIDNDVTRIYISGVKRFAFSISKDERLLLD
jgi:hypothetical protein